MANAPRPLVAGNWKMHALGEAGDALARGIVERWQAMGRQDVDVALCPPATLLGRVGRLLEGSGLLLGAQDCHWEAEGAHTGDISAPMLADAGCRVVILGHSERRQSHGETDEEVAAKTRAAHAAGLKAIVCVGESKAARDAGQTATVVETQLAASLPKGVSAANTAIAYEPIWAIGSGRTPDMDEIGAVHARIRTLLANAFGASEAFSVLYGGSVAPANAAEIMTLDEVNGVLVGGASLDAGAFCEIIESCG
ncbi:MAG: triose-phosphate isomerase [Alphaproteobacteria bacterium]|nr:triose-phosphate isomerase [Alphaproteobacteria bacterium]